MATLREFILNQSTLNTGNIVRDHIKNPSTGGPGIGLVLIDGLEIQVSNNQFDVEIDFQEAIVEIETSPIIVEIEDELIIEIEDDTFEMETC